MNRKCKMQNEKLKMKKEDAFSFSIFNFAFFILHSRAEGGE
jgi:hypothetical protein